MVPVGGDDLAYGGGVVCPAPVDDDECGIVRDGVKSSLPALSLSRTGFLLYVR